MDLRNYAPFYAVIFLFLIPGASALDSLYSGTIYSDQSFVAGDYAFRLYLGNNNNDVLADYGFGSLFLTNNSCEQTNAVRVCLNNIEYDTSLRLYKLTVEAVSLKPKLAITRTTGRSEFQMGEAAVISTSIVNTGGLASGVAYTDIFPEGIEVIDADGLSGTPRGVKWTGSIDQGETVSFSYKVRFDAILDRSFSAKLSYFDGIQQQILYSDALSITTTPHLQEIVTVGKSSMLVGEINNITINYTNRATQPIAINPLRIIAEPSVEFIRIPRGFTKLAPNILEWNGNLVQYAAANVSSTGEIVLFPNTYKNATNVTKAHRIFFRATKAGSPSIRVETHYQVGDFEDRLPSEVRTFTVTGKDVIMRYNLDDVEIEANQAKTLKLWFQNPNPFVSIKDVVIKLTSDLTRLPDVYVSEMGIQEQQRIIEKTFYAPAVNATKGFTIVANVSYETQYGDNVTNQFTFTQTVTPIKKIQILQQFGPSTVTGGEYSRQKIEIDNPRRTKLQNIEVSDAVPGQFEVIGRPKTTMTVEAEEQETAYEYILKAPRVNVTTTYTFNTTATYSDAYASEKFREPLEYVVTHSAPITVEPAAFPLTIARTIPQTTVYSGEIFDVEYSIENPSLTLIARNVELTLPRQRDLDLVGTKHIIAVGELQPREKISITEQEQRRAQHTGTLELQRAYAFYRNQYDETYNTTIDATQFESKSTPTDTHTFVTVEKSTNRSSSNTDSFTVTLAVTSTGKSITSAEIQDGDRTFSMALANGSARNITYTQKITEPGVHVLAQAIATYTDDGMKFTTASDRPTIIITENPLLTLTKTVPGQSTSITNYTVSITLQTAGKTLRNVTITDGSAVTHYGTLTEDTVATRSDRTRTAGQHSLAPATATYTYNGELYRAISNRPQITVIEAAPVVLMKSYFPVNAFVDDDVLTTLTLRNNLPEAVAFTIEDAGETWKIQAAPGMEQNITHTKAAGEISVESASTTYVYAKDTHTVKSAIPEFTVIGGEKGKVIKEEKGIIQKLLGGVISLLTWRKG